MKKEFIKTSVKEYRKKLLWLLVAGCCSGIAPVIAFDNSGDGITDTGAISGATSIDATGPITVTGATATITADGLIKGGGLESTNGIFNDGDVFDNNNQGINQAGNISGAGNISASGDISTTGTISGVGLTSTGGLTNSGGVFNNNSQGINGAGNINGAGIISASGSISTSDTISGVGLTSTGGLINNGGIFNNNSQGINNAGVVNGVTTLDAGDINSTNITNTGLLNVGGATTLGSTLNVADLSTMAGIANTGPFDQIGLANINQNSGDATNINAGISNGNVNIGNANNATNLNSANTNVGGDLTVTGATTLNGSATANGTLTVSNTGSLAVDGTATFTGATSINDNTSNGTTINTNGSTGSVIIGDAGNTTTLNSGTTTINGTTNVNGAANINVGGIEATNINTGGNTAAVNIGNQNNVTNLNSAINNIGVGTGGVTFNNIGTDSAYASTNDIGNSNAGTGVYINAGNSGIGMNNSVMGLTALNLKATAGSSTLSMADNYANLYIGGGGSFTATDTQARMAYGSNTLTVDGTNINGAVGSGSFNVNNASASIGNRVGNPLGGSYTSTAAPNVVGTSGDPLVNGDAASQANVWGASYVNRLQGNTLVDGNMYINGSLVYASSSSATTTVTSGQSILPDATQTTTGQMALVNKGEPGVIVDKKGKITRGNVPQSTASLTMTNGVGKIHGLVVNETQATLSGGTYSTSLTLDDGGARFSNAESGAPVRVTGVADGRTDFDAVNYRQLKRTEKRLSAGVAGTSAMANIPQVDESRHFSLGVGLGNFQDSTALALGASFRPARNTVFRLSASTVGGVKESTVIGVGAGFSW